MKYKQRAIGNKKNVNATNGKEIIIDYRTQIYNEILYSSTVSNINNNNTNVAMLKNK